MSLEFNVEECVIDSELEKTNDDETTEVENVVCEWEGKVEEGAIEVENVVSEWDNMEKRTTEVKNVVSEEDRWSWTYYY